MSDWDQRYSTDEYIYGRTPNAFLSAMTGRLAPGCVLCLADGEGRNSVHLARHGFSPTAVDGSSVGLTKARRLAEEQGVTVESIHADLADFTIAESSWDSIVSIFCHLPPDLRRTVHRAAALGLRPGGTFLLEAYTPAQLELGTGGPPRAELMMDLATLREELAGLEFLHGREVVREIAEGSKHTGEGAVVQVLARRPSAR